MLCTMCVLLVRAEADSDGASRAQCHVGRDAGLAALLLNKVFARQNRRTA
jgi:hypothetical protein